MGTFDVKIAHDGGDVVDRELPEIQRCILGDITGWVASGIVGNATVATGEVTHVGFPTADVRCEFMDEDDRITVATLLEIELRSGSLDIRHRFSPPIRNLRVRVQRQKNRSRCNRSALGIVSLRSMAWNHRCALKQSRLAGFDRPSTSRGASESEPALSTKTPVDSAARQHGARDLATKLLFQSRTPGHELEAEAIIDHRKSA